MHKIAIPQSAIDRVLKRRDSLHVFNDLDPARTAHVVVDLQNGFMAPGQPAEIPLAREIVPNVNRISAALRAAGGLVVYIQNTIDATAKEAWSNWFTHMSGERRADAMNKAFAPGSFGHSLWPELEVLPSDLKVNKNRFGAFVPGSSNLHAELQARNIDTVIITGTATNVCCESTARDAMMMNYKTIFVSDGTATYNDEEHNATLGIMVAMFADVMTTEEVLVRLSRNLSQAAE
ncbi:MAG: ureidoacrylate peracid hydrolase [Alphaproteobacteria bacterium]|jgi:ureidoacrylate peracid hydrolase|nr:ureidoacrylate peracid hydrolase [Alphaproteobacteria bacterium]